MKKITIIGFGRFGKTLYKLLRDDFAITLYNRSEIDNDRLHLSEKTTVTYDLAKAYESEVIFFAVPIASFESVINAHKKYFTDKHLLIDVLSVKLHPQQIFEKYLNKTKIQALLTHPMFGPDSSKDGFENLPIILDQFKTSDVNYEFWKAYFQKKQLRIVEMSAEEHDKTVATSQGVTHFIGRLLDEYGLHKTPIDSLGTKKLLQVQEQTCNDTWQLFNDLQHYNPYTKPMRIKLGSAYEKIYNKLLPEQVTSNELTIGIQGGRGSFNEEAIMYYLKRNNITNYHIKYLFTSENVLRALHEGETDLGIFAIHNSVGGIVFETIEAMGRYKFSIAEEFAITISHALMIRKDATMKEITTIMTHPQVLSQCRTTLAEKYPKLEKTSGEGELIDSALVAKNLSENNLPKNIAVMGSKVLAQIYDLQIIEDNLQDLKENYTSFLLVKRL